MTPDSPQQALPQLPNAPPPPPIFGQAPLGKKPGQKSSTPSFLGTQALPAQGSSAPAALQGMK